MFPKDVTADGLTQGNRTQGLGRGCSTSGKPPGVRARLSIFQCGPSLHWFASNPEGPRRRSGGPEWAGPNGFHRMWGQTAIGHGHLDGWGAKDP